MNLLLRPKFRLVVLATTTIASTTEATGSSTSFAVTKSVASNIVSVAAKRENVRRLLTAIQGNPAGKLNTPVSMSSHLEQDDTCDAKFIYCLPNANCINCFETLAIEAIDWTGVTLGTSCSDVVQFLTGSGHCTSLAGDVVATNAFCDAFDACVDWDEDDDDNKGGGGEEDDKVDCASLTECEWEGMHKAWVGDGVCHDNMEGCYNTAVCEYDGGDCCNDTCEITSTSSYLECGHDGYACKDPASDYCNSYLTTKCSPANGGGNNDPDPYDTKCDVDETKYRLVMFDSFGDGWDTTTLTIQAEGKSDDVIFKGGLTDGFDGTEFICLSKSPQCYNAQTSGGTWGVEVTWEIRPLSEGSPSIAGGAAPGDCDFSVAGEVCSKTCENAKPNIDPSKDPEYKDFKDLYSCIEKKCVIQLGACDRNEECQRCFSKDAPDYCYGIDTFVAIIDCTMCSCTEKAGSEFCTSKSGPGQVTPPIPKGDDENNVKQCTPKETMDGTSAIMDYASCVNLDSVSLLITDFDQNNFGQLDSFETCAHSYRDEDNHGGRTALSCMQILKNAMTNPTVDDKKDAPKEAISALAANLYDHAGTFCDCSKKASDACPLCPSFMNFKTILYESIDACQSLDAIDCDSWNEFWRPCKENLESEFQTSEFTNKDQCDFLKNDCGNAGPFPAFRRLDCEDEIPEEAWDFYKRFSKKCLKGSDGTPPSQPPSPNPPTPIPTPDKPKPAPKPAPVPIPVPVPIPTDPGDRPTPKPYIPSDDNDSKPYVPSSDGDKKSESHWFRNMFVFGALAGVCYYVYKKRFDGFNFVQYRRRAFGRGGFDYGMVNSSGVGESEMYGNLNSSTTFEPPTLPPTPQMMMNGP